MQPLIRLFSLRSKTVRQASTLLAITSLLSYVLGLLRNLIFYRFVAFDQLDAYIASFTLADLFLSILIVGAISSAVVPTLTALVDRKDEQRATEMTSQLLSWATLFFILLITISSIWMGPIMHLLVKNFDAERLALAVRLGRLVLFQTLFFSWSFILGGYLNAHRRFATYAFAPLVYNIALIIGGILAGKHGVVTITYAVIIGSFLHFLIQYVEAVRAGFRFRLNFRWDDDLHTIVRLMMPRGIDQGITQVVRAVYYRLGSGLERGSITIFSGMNDLQTTPTVVVANSLAVAYFPSLSSLIAEQKWEEVNVLINKVIRACLFVLLPMIGLGLVMRAQFVRLYIGIGHASWQNTDLAIQTLLWFLLGIIPASIAAVLTKVFFARKDTVTPMRVSMVSGIIAIAISLIGIRVLHGNVSTFAIAESAIVITEVVLYMTILHRRSHVNFYFSDLAAACSRYLAGTILLVAGSWATLHLVDTFYRSSSRFSTGTISGLFLQTIAALAVGSGAYFLYSTISSKEEMQWLRHALSSRLR